MHRLEELRARLRRRPVDPQSALRQAQAEAHRRALRDDARARAWGSPGGEGSGGF